MEAIFEWCCSLSRGRNLCTRERVVRLQNLAFQTPLRFRGRGLDSALERVLKGSRRVQESAMRCTMDW
jgi:hypothetical protein